MRLKVVLSIFCCLLLGACSDKRLHLEEGGEVSLADYAGQWLVVNYWAVWCKPCIEEIPELNALHQQPGYTVFGVNFDRARGEELQQQLDQLGVGFPQLSVDPRELFEQKRPAALPASMMISPGGQFAGWLMGPQTSETIKKHILQYESSN